MTREMSALPEPVKAFNDELAEMLTQKPPVSSSKMKDITRCAMRAQKYYKHIVMSVEKLIQKCKPEYKLSGIYVVDAIVRQSRYQNKDRDIYAGRFESNLHITATHLFKASKSDQVKICRTFKLWELNKVFSYHTIQKCLNNANPDARKEGITLAENSISKMTVKPVVTSDIAKQQKELEEQRKKIQEQQEELKKKQDALLKQNASAIPPILGNLLHFGQASENTAAVPEETNKATETANKVKVQTTADTQLQSLLDDFDYSDEDEIKQPSKKGTPKSRTTPTPSISTPKKPENLSTPSPVTTTHTLNSSIYEPDPPAVKEPVPKPTERYDTRNLEKLYTPSPIEKTSKRSKHKSPERNKKSHKTDRSRDSDKSRDTRDFEKSRDTRDLDKSRDMRDLDKSRDTRDLDKSRDTRDLDKSRDIRDRSREKSRDRSRDKTSRRKSSPEQKSSRKSSGVRSGKRSRSTSPDHYSKKKDKTGSKPDCVSVLSTTIWIGNLRKTVTKEDISSLMKKYTENCSIDMVPPRGCSYINLGDRDTAENVLKELKDLKLHGAPCKIAWAPGKGCKEYKEHWNIEKGVTYIPYKTFEKLRISGLEEGGLIAETTLPPGFKLQENEGAGTILEKLLVSMKGTSSDDPSAESSGPLGQFLANGQENAYITKQEEQVSAKLDKLNDIAIPSSVNQDNSMKHDEDSIVHLLNSKDYALPMPDNNTEGEDYDYTDHLSPPVTLEIPPDIPPDNELVTTPVPEEPLPYSRPVDEPNESSSQSETPLTESPMKQEKKTINLQTYLKRKKDDDPVDDAIKEDSLSQEENLPPTPVKTPKDTEVDDDLIEWASQDAGELPAQSPEEIPVQSPEEIPAQSPEEIPTQSPVKLKSPEPEKKVESPQEKTPEVPSPVPEVPSPTPVVRSPTPEVTEALTPSLSQVETSQEDSQEEIEAKVASIRSPSVSPVDSLLEEKITAPLTTPSIPPVIQQQLDNMEEGELEPDSEEAANKSRSRSQSHSSRKLKKDKKKKKKKNKKKKDLYDSDLEEDIRKLELLKAELEREERREKKEREKRRQRKRSASPRTSRDKKKKEKRQRR